METSKLKDILDQHKLWLETNGMQGQYAYLTGANLCGANLEGANLFRANLRGADLKGADLKDADITGANLENAYLCGANLYRANLYRANLYRANLGGADLKGSNLTGAYLSDAYLSNAILPDISWIIPGCLVHLNQINYGFYLEKECKWENFVQDSFGFFIQNNGAEKTFDMLVEDRIIRNIPDWVKYSGLNKLDP